MDSLSPIIVRPNLTSQLRSQTRITKKYNVWRSNPGQFASKTRLPSPNLEYTANAYAFTVPLDAAHSLTGNISYHVQYVGGVGDVKLGKQWRRLAPNPGKKYRLDRYAETCYLIRQPCVSGIAFWWLSRQLAEAVPIA
ncbi:hypothetical protein N7536_000482 [Penicillium majusculum]|uniref:Uncharacterized protein n=1 Tax=Penicillium solitum TaxID=60172 RepID=A0A1V6QTH5_9EURO|nr:uncharacterized protein PENSOL_c040G00673 [Penicillium solitum]KAJ5704793.1 hypothetical protein N7536_000482 [Penicillium majusculum]OQD92515.1 hypothetical protein PENSOL_c040G00673 [Penicillium solitum]